MSLIQVRNLTKLYNSSIAANNNISFSIEQGEVIGLLGKNGAGKTTLLSILGNEFPYTSGSILINGKELKKAGLNMVCTVQQEFGLFDFLTVYDHLKYFATLRSSKQNVISNDTIQKTVNDFKLESLLNRKTIYLSGGEKRRIILAMALMTNSEILILDEPTASLDIEWKNYIIDFLFSLNREKNTTIIYSSHNLDEVEKITNKVLILDQGQLKYFDKIDAVLEKIPYKQKITIRDLNYVNKIKQQINIGNKDILIFDNNIELNIFFTNNDIEYINSFLISNKIVYSYQSITLDDFFKFAYKTDKAFG